ncbi:GNAT family N-acetyltransferase [Cellulomonas pakistanensis]|uniref:GNAT family N-acetyltransferase n=1 Tax=Cellulomonas pakistanensis TaxID=992287 RepID=UPI0019414FB4|nr:GNAT family N-acetyltransferase [Cellulomonas pakistanensis]
MHARLVPLPRVTAADARAWRRLADAAVEPNLYLDPRFLVPARHRGTDVHDLRLLVVEEGTEWLALLAVTTTTVAPGVPLRAVTTGGTFMTTHSDRHHPLVRAGREVEALGALLRGLREVGLPGLVQLQHFPADGPLADALARVLGRGGMLVHERRRTASAFARRAAVPVDRIARAAPGTPLVDPPLAVEHMGTGRRKDLRRRVRGLARDAGGPLELHDVSDDCGVDEEFAAFQAAGWKGDAERGGAALALDRVAYQWFRDVAAGFRRDGDAVVLRLTAGGETLFMSYALRSGGAYFGFLDAYGEQHGKFSPGAVGRLAELTYVLAATDATAFDPAFDARYATGTQLYPERREYVDLLVSTRGLVARTAVRAAPVAERLGLGAARAVGVPLVPAGGESLAEWLALVA